MKKILICFIIIASTYKVSYSQSLQSTVILNSEAAFNVINFGAKGDGNTDDTKAIQDALDQVVNRISNSVYQQSTSQNTTVYDNLQLGGAVYFPPGIYLISNTLKVPPKCTLIGIGGSFTQLEYDGDLSQFVKNQPVVLVLKGGVSCNMIEPMYLSANKKTKKTLSGVFSAIDKHTFAPFESVIIDGISLYGNRGTSINLKTADQGNGIYIPDEDKGLRPNFILRNMLISNMASCGFYCGKNNKEYILENVFSTANGKDGFFFDQGCEDVNFNRAGAGGNGRNGFGFNQVGSFRFINCDSWGNTQNGMYIYNSDGFLINELTTDINKQSGVKIVGSAYLSFVNVNFTGNSRESNGKYPEVDLEGNPNQYGSFAIKFIGCRFGSMDSNQKTLYAIQDNASTIRNNSVIGCSFIQQSIGNSTNNDICNSAVEDNYIFDGCSAGPVGESEYVNPVKYRWFDTIDPNQKSTTPSSQNYIIDVNTSTSDFNVILPSILAVPVGKEYIIIKQSALNNINVTLINSSERLNGMQNGSIVISGSGKSYTQTKIINGGGGWILLNN